MCDSRERDRISCNMLVLLLLINEAEPAMARGKAAKASCSSLTITPAAVGVLVLPSSQTCPGGLTALARGVI